jgi:hypothetical protein
MFWNFYDNHASYVESPWNLSPSSYMIQTAKSRMYRDPNEANPKAQIRLFLEHTIGPLSNQGQIVKAAKNVFSARPLVGISLFGPRTHYAGIRRNDKCAFGLKALTSPQFVSVAAFRHISLLPQCVCQPPSLRMQRLCVLFFRLSAGGRCEAKNYDSPKRSARRARGWCIILFQRARSLGVSVVHRNA